MGIDYNTYSLSRKEKLAVFAGLSLILACIGILFYHTVITAALSFALLAPALRVTSRYLMKKRKKKLRSEFRDFLDLLSSSFATGRHMEEAMEEALPELRKIRGEDSLMAREIEQILTAVRESGGTIVSLLEDFGRRSGLEEAGDFVQVYASIRETGGDLIRSMDRSCTMLTEKMSIESDIEVIVSQKKMEGGVIAMMPVIILLFLRLMAPEYIAPLYEGIVGRVIMTLALAGALIACVMIERITEIEV